MRAVRLKKDVYEQLVSARGWATQTQQAREIGVAESTLSRVFRGVAEPNGETVGRFLDAFGVEYAELFELRDDAAVSA